MGGMGELREAWGHLLAGRIRPVVHAVLPASRLAEAHALLEGRSVAGKVVVAWDLG
jgi:NADPH2:quinone reductase